MTRARGAVVVGLIALVAGTLFAMILTWAGVWFPARLILTFLLGLCIGTESRRYRRRG